MSKRFPFTSSPRGWYVIAFSSDLRPGEVKTVHYFERDIVLFRTVPGVATAVDPTCPHLGAHLGGGRVEGDCLRCPFHDWAFDQHGVCVDVPYAPRIPAQAKIRTWPLREQDGAIFVYFSDDGSAPTWELPKLESDGWTPNRTIRWEVGSHPQEVGENTVDCSHLRPVHHVTRTDILAVEQAGHVMHVVLHLLATGAAIQMPEEINDVELDVTLHGLGQIISRTHVITAGLHTRQRIHPTPIGDDRIAIFAIANTKEMPDPGYTKEIDDIFWAAFVEDFARDFPIWENKVYLERPLLAGGDGPIGRYRKWCRQFYVPETSAVAQAVAQAASPIVEPAANAATAAAAALPAQKGPLGRLVQWLRRGSERPAITDSVNAPIAAAGSDDFDYDVAPPPSILASPVATVATGAPSAPRFGSVEAYFDSLGARFDGEAAGNLDAVFQWILTGEAGRSHFAEIKGRQLHAAAGRHPSPTVTIEMSSADYLLMINGELNGARAFSTGRGKLKGPVMLAMKMQRIFPLDRTDESPPAN